MEKVVLGQYEKIYIYIFAHTSLRLQIMVHYLYRKRAMAKELLDLTISSY